MPKLLKKYSLYKLEIIRSEHFFILEAKNEFKPKQKFEIIKINNSNILLFIQEYEEISCKNIFLDLKTNNFIGINTMSLLIQDLKEISK